MKNKGLRQLLAERAIEHWRTKSYSPQTNGKVERLQQTMDREWARGLSYRSSADRRAALPHWLLLIDGLDADLGNLAVAYERAAESETT